MKSCFKSELLTFSKFRSVFFSLWRNYQKFVPPEAELWYNCWPFGPVIDACIFHVCVFLSIQYAVVPPAGSMEIYCVSPLFLWTLQNPYCRHKKTSSRTYHMKVFLIYILEKLHEPTPNHRVMQRHYNIIQILFLFSAFAECKVKVTQALPSQSPHPSAYSSRCIRCANFIMAESFPCTFFSTDLPASCWTVNTFVWFSRLKRYIIVRNVSTFLSTCLYLTFIHERIWNRGQLLSRWFKM